MRKIALAIMLAVISVVVASQLFHMILIKGEKESFTHSENYALRYLKEFVKFDTGKKVYRLSEKVDIFVTNTGNKK